MFEWIVVLVVVIRLKFVILFVLMCKFGGWGWMMVSVFFVFVCCVEIVNVVDVDVLVWRGSW